MRRRLRVSTLPSLVALAVPFCACGSQPVAPTATPRVVKVEVAGPESIPPGQSAQFTATSVFSDGTRQPVTNHQWVFSNGLARVDASGVATAGQDHGEGLIRVRVTTSAGWVGGDKVVLVLPESTYRVVGRVTEQETPSRGIVGAFVEVVGDSRVTALTNSDGEYRLYGVRTGTDVRVMRDGYRAHVERVEIAEHTERDFQLALSGARLDLSGSYTLAIGVECGTTSTPVRPLELRHRSYAAVLTQTGSVIDVLLAESERFAINPVGRGNHFTGYADAAGATFRLQEFWTDYGKDPASDPSDYPDLLERLPDLTLLQIEGTAVTLSTPDGFAGELKGGVAHYASGYPQVPPGQSSLGVCGTISAPPHKFTLTRR